MAAANGSPTYSRDEVVAELTSFYEFLTGVHIPASAIKYPPPGGWPDISSESLAAAAGLRKSDIAVDLIRHIPFIERDGDDDPYQIYDHTCGVDYNGEDFVSGVDPGDPIEDVTTVSEHVVTLAGTPGGRDGHYFFLDTERGTITMCDFQTGPWTTELSQAVDDDSAEIWRQFETYTVKDFFEKLKEEFRTFEVIPTAPDSVRMVSRCRHYDMDRLKDVYREHGWLTENYRKEECMQRAKEVWREIFM